MAAVAPPGPVQAPPPQNDIPGALSTISWEGDKMFNIYIYDYCYKRGFRKTARELLLEAEIAPDATPPIDARQGLLFEWWSVFWVLFQAKSGGGSDDALVYTQHQAQRLASQRLQPPGALSSASIPPGSQPAQPPLPSQQQQGQQPPQQMGRFVNGIPRPGSTYLTNGPAPNGILTGMPQLQPGVSFSVGPPSLPSTQPQQPNGVPGGPQQPPPPGGINPGNQPMQFTSLMPGQPQRQPPPLMNGHPQQQQQPQQRGPANNGPFQSPTMAHSPQNNAGTPGHSGQPGPSNQPQQGHQQGQPSMGQFGGPSPNMAHAHMSRTGMLPPNGGLPVMNPMGPGQQQQQLPQQPGAPPTSGYPQQQQQQGGGGRPPSRTNTPGGMMHSSPSLAPRQPPPDGMGGGAVTENNINAEVMRIPQMMMNSLKREFGLAEKDFGTLTMAEKNRILYAFRSRSGPPGNRNPNQKPGQQDNNAAAGPSTGIMQAPGQQGQRGPPQQPPHPQPRIKRNSTSPGEEHETLPRNESSPPERKRVRRSPAEQQSTMQTISYPHHPQQQQGQGQQGQQPPQQQQQQNLPQPQQNQPGQPTTAQLQMQHQQQIMMMRSQMGLNGPIGPPPPLTGPVPQPQIGPGATPLINNSLMMHGAPGMHAMYRQRMNAANPGEPFNPGGGPPGVGGGPGGPQFTPGGLNRMTQNKPGIGGSMMPPPPSPGMNGAPKDNNGVNGKDTGGNKGLGPGGNNNPGSPRNQPPPNSGGGGGTAPPTPVPVPQPNPQQQQQLGNQNSLNPTPPTMMGVVPNSGPGGGLTGGGSTGLGGPQPDLNTMFNPEFMSNMTSSLEDFPGADLFRTTGPDGDINFERDFGQWFINPDDVGAGLDMK